jgi:hypothetical protein
MAFELWTDGVRLVDRFIRLFDKRPVGRDPLSGIVDGSNTIFYSNYQPILSSGSVGLYTSGSLVFVQNTDYTLDYDAGMFNFTNAPSVQPTASYVTAKFSDYQIKSILVAGFDEMEGRWHRNYSLSLTTDAGVVPITEDSATAYITDSSGSDPVIGSITFSQSRTQLNLYAKCVQYAYLTSLQTDSSLNGLIWREAQGLSVDKSKVPQNLELALKRLDADILKALNTAQLELHGTGVWGGTITPPHTRDFIAHRWWERASSDQDWNSNTTYVGDLW